MHALGLTNLDLYITGKCNYCCAYCYGEDNIYGDMDKDVYSAALKFGQYIGVDTMQLCGGEPLMAKMFKYYVSAAKDAGFKVTLRTNGIMLEDYLSFVALECDWVGISIDGLPAENAFMRASRTPMTASEQFMKPMRALTALKEFNPRIKILLATLASKKNYTKIPLFARYLVENNFPIDIWKIYEFIRDKFRSNVNFREFEMTEAEFEILKTTTLMETGGKFPVFLQSAHTEKVGANCLIVNQRGNINLQGKHYGNVISDPFDNIIDCLLTDDVFSVISANKIKTYSHYL